MADVRMNITTFFLSQVTSTSSSPSKECEAARICLTCLQKRPGKALCGAVGYLLPTFGMNREFSFSSRV
jgi:hypothetical protein